jgi:hypothetical protein
MLVPFLDFLYGSENFFNPLLSFVSVRSARTLSFFIRETTITIKPVIQPTLTFGEVFNDPLLPTRTTRNNPVHIIAIYLSIFFYLIPVTSFYFFLA